MQKADPVMDYRFKQSIGKEDFVRDFEGIKKLIDAGYTYNELAKLYIVSVHWVREFIRKEGG